MIRSGVRSDAMFKILLIALGGAAGTLLRYSLGGWIQRGLGGGGGAGFPVGTLTVNVSGCFAIGFLGMMFASSGSPPVNNTVKMAVLIGVLGGYTTFSSFGFETLAMAQRGQWPYAAVNVLASNAAGLCAVWLGYMAARKLFGV